jgi:Bacterial Ig domain
MSVERTNRAHGVDALQFLAPAYDPGVQRVERMPRFMRRRRFMRGSIASLCIAAATLAGCGGGLFLGIELGGSSDQPPSVALSAAVSEAAANDSVHLAAAASDDFGVDSVSFYRQEPAGPATLLGTDIRSPYQIDTTIPASPVGTVWRYFARAFDGAGQHADSEVVAITVR